MSILWIMDRFGAPGQYHAIWTRLMRDNYIPTKDVKVFQLHKHLKKTLLMKLGSRKAPTWIPECTGEIITAIEGARRAAGAKAVVLASPESLAILGLAPEHATLQNLRGSVYWLDGIPHLVMLPMSAWNSMVSQKEIGAANYGFESQDTFAAGQQGALPEAPIRGNGGDSRDSDRDSDRDDGSVSADSGEVGDEEDEEESVASETDVDDGGSDGDVLSLKDRDESVNHDLFFYEPVLSPVGRFVLTADTQKLHRLLRDGKNAAGPSKPIQLKWGSRDGEA